MHSPSQKHHHKDEKCKDSSLQSSPEKPLKESRVNKKSAKVANVFEEITKDEDNVINSDINNSDKNYSDNDYINTNSSESSSDSSSSSSNDNSSKGSNDSSSNNNNSNSTISTISEEENTNSSNSSSSSSSSGSDNENDNKEYKKEKENRFNEDSSSSSSASYGSDRQVYSNNSSTGSDSITKVLDKETDVEGQKGGGGTTITTNITPSSTPTITLEVSQKKNKKQKKHREQADDDTLEQTQKKKSGKIIKNKGIEVLPPIIIKDIDKEEVDDDNNNDNDIEKEEEEEEENKYLEKMNKHNNSVELTKKGSRETEKSESNKKKHKSKKYHSPEGYLTEGTDSSKVLPFKKKKSKQQTHIRHISAAAAATTTTTASDSSSSPSSSPSTHLISSPKPRKDTGGKGSPDFVRPFSPEEAASRQIRTPSVCSDDGNGGGSVAGDWIFTLIMQRFMDLSEFKIHEFVTNTYTLYSQAQEKKVQPTFSTFLTIRRSSSSSLGTIVLPGNSGSAGNNPSVPPNDVNPNNLNSKKKKSVESKGDAYRNTYLRNFFLYSKEPSLHSLIRTAKSFFILCSEEAVDIVLKWRENKTCTPVRPGPKHRRTGAIPGGGGGGGSTRVNRTTSAMSLGSSKSDLGEMENANWNLFKSELTRLGFDYITAAFLSFMFEDQAEDVVSKNTLDKIIDLSFGVMKRPPAKIVGEGIQQCYLSNFSRTSDLYGYLLSVLHSESSMATVYARYIRELQTAQIAAFGGTAGSSSGSSGSGGSNASGGSASSDPFIINSMGSGVSNNISSGNVGSASGGNAGSSDAGTSAGSAAASSGSGTGGDPCIVLSLLNGIRFIRPKITYGCTCEFLRQYFEFFRGREKEFQRDVFNKYLDIFSKIVHKLVSETSNGEEAPSELKALAQSIWVWVKKNLRPSQSNSLLTLLLCLCDKDFFCVNWWNNFAEPLYKEKKTRALGLDAIPILAERYTTLKSVERDVATDLIRIVAVRLFPTSKKTIIQSPEDPLDRQVDFVCCMANAMPEFVIDNILLPNLLRVPEPGTPLEHFVPDRLVVGLRALYVIHRATLEPLLSTVTESSGLVLPPRSFYGSNEYSFGIVRSNKASLLTSRYSALSKMFSNIIDFIVSCGVPSKTYDYFTLFHEAEKVMLALVPFLFDGLNTEPLLKFIMARLDNTEKMEKDNVFISIFFLFVFRPTLRESIISFFTRYILELPHNQDSIPLATSILTNIGTLIYKFDSVIRDSKKACTTLKDIKKTIPIDGGSFERKGLFSSEFIATTEANIFIFFLAPNSNLRAAAIQALENVKNLHKYSTSNSNEISLWNILDGCGTSVVDECFSSLDRFQVPTKIPFTQTVGKTVLEYVASDMTRIKNARLLLAIFAEVGRAVSREAPEMARRLCSIIIRTRLPKVKPIFSSQQQGIPQSPLTNELWWGSYMAFCFAAFVPVEDSGKKEEGSGENSEECPDYSSLMEFVLPCAHNYCEHNKTLYKDSEVTPINMLTLAIERCNIAGLELLLRSLEPLFADITLSAATTKAVKERTRNMLASTVAYIARYAPKGALVQTPYLTHFFVRFVENELEFYSDPANKFIWDTYTYSRHHFCVFLSNFLKYCGWEGENGLSTAKREQLFDLLSTWAAVDARFNEDPVQKRINAEIDAACKGVPKKRELVMGSILDYNTYLSYSATSAIVTLGLGLTDNICTMSRVFSWAEGLILRTLRPKRKELPKPRRACDLTLKNTVAALKSFLLNTENEEIRTPAIHSYIEMCYSSTHEISEAYFCALVGIATLPDGHFLFMPENSLSSYIHLSMYMSLNESKRIRHKTQRLIEFVYAQTVETLPPMFFGSSSSLEVTYSLSSIAMSKMLAKCFAPEAYNITTECAKHVADVQSAEGMLEYLLPWIERMDFSVMTPIKSEALCNLVYMTFMFRNKYRHQVTSFWTTLAKKPYNIAPIISRLLDLSTLKNSDDFADVTKTICLYLVSEAPKATVDRLVGELIFIICESKEIPFPESDENMSDNTLNGLKSSMPLGTTENSSGEHFKAHLPSLLHILVLGFDYPELSIYENCRVLLLNLIRCIVIKYFVKIGLRCDESEEFSTAVNFCEYIESKENDAFWDKGPMEGLDDRVVTFIMRILQVFSMNREYSCNDTETDTAVLQKKWATEAHMWAVGCPQVTQAIRSCQIYRILTTEYTMEQVQTLLERTAPLLASDDMKEIRLASEGLRTLEHIVRLMTREQLLGEYKDIFWAACATLYSDCEEHFTISVKLIGTLLEKLPDIGETKTFEILLSSIESANKNRDNGSRGRARGSSNASRNDGSSFKDFESLILYGFICSTAQDDIANVLSAFLSVGHKTEDELTTFSAALIVITLWLSENAVKCPKSRRPLVKDVASRFYAALAAHGAEDTEKSYSRLVGWKYTTRREFISDIENPIISIVCSNSKTTTTTLALLLGIADTPVCDKYLDIAMHIASKIVYSAPPDLMHEFSTPAKAAYVFGPLATMIADKSPPEYPQTAPWRDQAIDVVFWILKSSPLSTARTKDFDHETWRLSSCSTSSSFHVFSKIPAAGGLKAKSALDEVTERMSEKFSSSESYRSSLVGKNVSSPISASSLSASDTCSCSSSSSSSSSSSTKFKPLHERSSSKSSTECTSCGGSIPEICIPGMNTLAASAVPGGSGVPFNFPSFSGFEEMLSEISSYSEAKSEISENVRNVVEEKPSKKVSHKRKHDQRPQFPPETFLNESPNNTFNTSFIPGISPDVSLSNGLLFGDDL